ncbi:MAG: cytochrome b/b6 domain-containing protein [Thiolinea sp.]
MTTKTIKIWDIPTRLFHWTLVAGIGFMWFSAEISDSLMERHMQVGEFLLALILFRIIWGFVGSESARFTAFLRSPVSVLQYAKTLPNKKPSWHAGHNPLGGWMVVVLLLIVLLQAGSGLFITDDVLAEGPLYALVSGDLADQLLSMHHILFNVLTGLIVLHITAIIFYWAVKRTNLIKAMLGGRARIPATEAHSDLQDVNARSPWLGLLIFAVCYATVHFGLRWLAG